MTAKRRSIEAIGDKELYDVLHKILSQSPNLRNEELFKLARAELGFLRLGSRIRFRLLKAVKRVRPSVLILDK